MVKIEDAGCPFDAKTAAIDYISLALDNRQYEVTNFFWGILEIGILNDSNLPRDFLQTTSYCCCLPRIPLLSDETYLGKTQCLYFLAGVVSRTIVYDNHLFKATQTVETLEYLGDGGCLIIGWHHDRQDGQAQPDFRWSGLLASIVAVR
jgi:hypothetical protein